MEPEETGTYAETKTGEESFAGWGDHHANWLKSKWASCIGGAVAMRVLVNHQARAPASGRALKYRTSFLEKE